MVRVAVLGASGYAGGEAVRLLASHPHVTVSVLMADRSAGRPFSEVYPALRGQVDAVLEPLEPERVAGRAEVAILSLPAGQAHRHVPALLEAGVRVIDLGADFRLRDPEVYRRWYGQVHASPELLGEGVYGLTEWHRDEVAGARLVANPGCYPTAALLAALPLARAGLVEPDTWTVTALSGVTGAGRALQPEYLFAEVEGSVRAYGLDGHRHTPEMVQELARWSGGAPVGLVFVPHLVPMSRGLLATVSGRLARPASAEEVLEVLAQAYAGEPFVQVGRESPATRHVLGTNRCALTARVMGDRVVAVAAIDNLGKGAAGQAVQNLNCMVGLPETAGLAHLPLLP